MSVTERAAPVDVLVVGGGNAGLCAAISAAEAGATVLLLERAPFEWRGGNSKYTRNVRTVRRADDPAEVYSEEELLSDLVGVSGELPDRRLAELVIEESERLPSWMEEHGIRWQAAMRGTLGLQRTNRFFLGGGKALVNRYYERLEDIGVEVRYEAGVAELEVSGNRFEAAVVDAPGRRHLQPARSLVVASGGMESNLEWLERVWGEAARNFIIRGTSFNDGRLLQHLLEQGAAPVGSERALHAIAVDARSPKFDGGIVTRVDAIPFGIVVNRDGRRFYDEGEDAWPKRYALWGRLLAEQPEQTAHVVFDAAAQGSFIPPLFPPYVADSIRALAVAVGLDAEALSRTVEEFNGAAADGATTGIDPPKSRWAEPIRTPPFYAYPLRPGITFTYRGVRVDADARVVRNGHGAFENVFAAGEVMAGNILSSGYLGGFGMTIGSVMGRIAGQSAARHGR
jgi:tricarballylate dehydrogenase